MHLAPAEDGRALILVTFSTAGAALDLEDRLPANIAISSGSRTRRCFCAHGSLSSILAMGP